MKTLFLFLIVLTSVNVFAADGSANNPNNIYVPIARKLIPSVVNIFTTSNMRGGYRDQYGGQDDLWRKFFEDFFGGQDPFGGGQGGVPQPKNNIPKAMSLGSGFIIEANSTHALILTNNHVVDGADNVKVKFTESAEDREVDAEIVGTDPDLDVALLKVKIKRKLTAVVLGDSEKLEVGEWILALGNPFGHGHSVSHGIVSAKERALPGGFGKYIQVDAPINPGNSGGPLVNLNGEVVGINNAIDARGPGIGFAIPINHVKASLTQLKTKGRVDRGYIGVSIDEVRPEVSKELNVPEDLAAPFITNIVPGQPADKAGLKTYDVITEVNGKKIYSAADLVGSITDIPVGEKAKLKVLRAGKEKVFEVMIEKRPDFRMARNRMQPPNNRKQKQNRIDTGMMLENIDSDIAKELGLPENYSGAVVARVAPGGPAALAGIARGDVILEVDRKPVKNEEDFYRVVNKRKTYLLRVRRQDEGGRETFSVISLKLADSE